jgi:hypothetical protein|tara:strand:+ start:1656 stop:2699 length:1044 start_codon:yes stop_codon:yes gene_type:complete
MAANIFGDRFFGRRTPAWHRVGTVMDADMTATEAMRISKIGFPVRKLPAFIQLENGQFMESGHYGVVREPTDDDPQDRVLSMVGKEWTPIQAWDLAKMLDPISEKYPVETMGALGHGEKIFMTLDAGEGAIAGEDHRMYYLVTDHRDGMGALSIAFTPVRVVCQNTLTTGLASAKVSVNLKHNRNIRQDAEWYVYLFNNMLQAKEKVIPVMNRLAEYRIDETEAKSIINSAYPEASKPRRLTLSQDITPDDVSKEVWLSILNDKTHHQDEYERRLNRLDAIRAGAWDRYQFFNDKNSRLANTPWGAWQAVVETEDFRKGRANSATSIFGMRAEAKSRAFKTALALCN